MANYDFGFIAEGSFRFAAEYSAFLARWGVKTIYSPKKRDGKVIYVVYGDNIKYIKLIRNTKFLLEEEQVSNLINAYEKVKQLLRTEIEKNNALSDENNALLGID